MKKKIMLAILITSMCVMAMSGCTTSKQNVKVANIKNGLEDKVMEMIIDLDFPDDDTALVLGSLEFTYDDPQIVGDSIGFNGEFSFILGEKKYIQPFKVTGVLSNETFSFSTEGQEMRSINIG